MAAGAEALPFSPMYTFMGIKKLAGRELFTFIS
jgi:hypothetical protein